MNFKSIILFAILFKECECFDMKTRTEFLKNFALDYFMTRGIRRTIMFLCWPNYDSVDIMKKFSLHDTTISLPVRNKNKMPYQSYKSLFHTYTSRVGIVFDFCCNDTYALKKYPYFNGSYVWMFFDCNNWDKIINSIENLPIGLNTDLIVTNTSVDMNYVDLYDIYHTGQDRNGQLMATFVDRLSENRQNSWKKYFETTRIFYRRDLNGIVIRTVTLTENNKNKIDTHEYLMDNFHLDVDTAFKMNYQMIWLLKQMYNFTIKFVLANNWSTKNLRGLYESDNLLGILFERRADILAGALLLRKDRLDMCEVLFMTYPLRCGFIFRHTGEFDTFQSNFNNPFDNFVWGTYVAVAIMVIFTIFVIVYYESRYIPESDIREWTTSEIILSVIGACCQMGSGLKPITSANRLVYFIFFFSSLVIYNYFTSSIVSALLNVREQKFTIKELADSSLQCGSIEVGFFHNLLFDTPIYPNLDYFNARKKTKKFYWTVDEGIEKVKHGGFAFHGEYNAMYKRIDDTFSATEICQLQEIDTMPREMMGILVIRSSPYSELFKFGMYRAAEAGHLKKETDKWFSKKPLCQKNLIFSQVRLRQILSTFIFLFIGVTISVIVMSIEKIQSRSRISKKDFSKIKGKKITQ